jgi:hypothetical protein
MMQKDMVHLLEVYMLYTLMDEFETAVARAHRDCATVKLLVVTRIL